MAPTPPALLVAALAADPARPLVTFYDDQTGERVELSVATFANWVAKTANLLVDTLGVVPGDLVVLRLPRHWQTAVWAGACWAVGVVVSPDADPATAAVAVCDEGGLASALAAPEVVALSLAPMGAPFPPGVLPPRVLDYGREVLGHGDRFAGPLPSAAAPALLAGGRTASAHQVVEDARDLASGWGLAETGRLLVATALDPVTDLLAGAVVPLARAGSCVLVRHPDDRRLGARAEQERVTATAG